MPPVRAALRCLPAVVCLLAIGLAPGASRAAEPERYAYLFLQGKLSASGQGHPEAGVTIRLTSKDRTFETRSDDRGVFVFERLPVASYDLRLITSDGQVMRSVRPFDEPRGIRLEVRSGKGEGKVLHLDATSPSGRVTYEVPESAPDWGKFWKEFGVIVGAAGIFAL